MSYIGYTLRISSAKKMSYLPSLSTMVPVPFNLKVLAFGLAAPLGRPKEADGALRLWDPDGGTTAPDMFETPGLEVVLRAKVLAVGAPPD